MIIIMIIMIKIKIMIIIIIMIIMIIMIVPRPKNESLLGRIIDASVELENEIGNLLNVY
jgi:hypothetical protein